VLGSSQPAVSAVWPRSHRRTLRSAGRSAPLLNTLAAHRACAKIGNGSSIRHCICSPLRGSALSYRSPGRALPIAPTRTWGLGRSGTVGTASLAVYASRAVADAAADLRPRQINDNCNTMAALRV
jgi:hypothetical protein